MRLTELTKYPQNDGENRKMKNKISIKSNERTMGNGNLRHFPKGKSGNPKGRPKGSRDGLRAHLMRALRKKPTDDIKAILKANGVSVSGPDNAEWLVHVLLASAASGNLKAIQIILEQTESPLPRQINMGDSNGASWNPVLVYVPDNGRN